MNTKVIYLHGFASGPSSAKAQFYREHLIEIGADVAIPDLNGTCFSDMTITGQLQILQNTVDMHVSEDEPLILIGSSMGGLLATLIAPRIKQVRGLILMAPGFGLNKRWPQMIGEENMNNWKESGSHSFFHYALKKEMPLAYNFVKDISRYETDGLKVDVPTLVFHGGNDETVPVEESISFKQNNPQMVDLHVLDSDHQLLNALPEIWDKSLRFMIDNRPAS